MKSYNTFYKKYVVINHHSGSSKMYLPIFIELYTNPGVWL